MKSRKETTLKRKKQMNFLVAGIAAVLLYFALFTVEVMADDRTRVDIIRENMVQYTLYDDYSADVTGFSTGITSAVIPAQITYDDNVYVVKTIAERAFSSSTLQSITISDGITTIGKGAFQYCGSLTKVSLPKTLTVIEGGAFYDCSMESIVLPEGLTSIGYGAFQCCEELKSLNFPSTLTSVEGEAFALTAIESLTIPASLTNIGANTFQTCRSLKSVTLLNHMTAIPEGMFTNCSSLTELNFLNNITTIGASAFSGCTGLTTLTIPKGVTTIGEKAFSGCTNIKTAVIPDGVTTIGKSAFALCKSLESVQMTDSVTSMGNSVFNGCSALTDIRLSNSITSIGEFMFYGCTALETIQLPENITSIGELAFNECRGLSYIVVPEGVTSIGDQAFYSCSGLEYIILPSTLETTGSYWCTIYDENNSLLYLPAIYYPAGTAKPSGDGWGVTKVKASYDENADGTISVTLDYVSSMAGNEEISIPESIGGKTITSLEYGADVSDSYKTLTFACTKHYATQWSRNEYQHFYAVCSICGKTNVEVAAHGYGDGTQSCLCGYVPFTLTSSSQSQKAVTGYTQGPVFTVAVAKTMGAEKVTYQWYENGKPIEGATDTSYQITTGKNVGTYTYMCKVTCGAYEASSAKSVFSVEKSADSDTNDTGNSGNTGGDSNIGDDSNTGGGSDAGNSGNTGGGSDAGNSGNTGGDSDAGNSGNTEGGSNAGNNSGTGEGNNFADTGVSDTGNDGNAQKQPEAQKKIKVGTKFTVNGIKYKVTTVTKNGGNVKVIGLKNKKKTSVRIPATMTYEGKKYKVTTISESAFKDCKKLKKIVLKKNVTIIVSGIKYKVTSVTTSGGNVKVTGLYNKKKTSVTIPATLKYGGKKYKVTAIGANAFKNNKVIKKVTLGSNILSIGSKAFYGCTKITSITIPKKVSIIGKLAFYKCTNLKNITIKTTKLTKKKVGSKAFKRTHAKVKVKVPKKKLKAYKRILKAGGISKKATIK